MKKHLKYLSKRYKDESTIIAYDLLNEPSFFHKGHTKLEARMIVSKWTSTIRKQTSHQLITIGLADSHTSFDWDPILLDVDFYSFHIYPGKNGDINNDKISD